MRDFLRDAAIICGFWLAGTAMGFGLLVGANEFLTRPAAQERKELRDARLETDRAKQKAEAAERAKLLLEAELTVARDAARRAGTRVDPVGGVEVPEVDRIPMPAVPFPTR